MVDAVALLTMEALCGPSTIGSAAAEFGPFASPASPELCGVPHVLQIFAGSGRSGDGNGGGRCHVWAANFFLTLGVLSVVLVRIWCTCGDLPPSDAAYEPAAGKVIHSGLPDAGGQVDKDDDNVDIQLMVADALRGSRSAKASAGPRKGATASLATPFVCTSASAVCGRCGTRLRSYAREEQTSAGREHELSRCPYTPEAALASSRAAAAASAQDVKPAAPTRATARGGSGGGVGVCHSPLRCRLTRAWRCVVDRCQSFFSSCATASAMLRMPFSALERYSYMTNHADLRRLQRRLGRRLRETLPSQEAGRASSSDSDGEEGDEDAAAAAEQEELWGLLLAIEHRRRALTGRNLYGEQLPARPRHGHRHRYTSDAVRWATQQLRTVARPPIVASAVPLRFSTNRQERPLLEDRRGRWIPVAVTDDEGQRYDYRVDQVLPDR